MYFAKHKPRHRVDQLEHSVTTGLIVILYLRMEIYYEKTAVSDCGDYLK